MLQTELSKLKKIEDLRTVWRNEVADFTPWLAQEENIDLLSEAIGIDISIEEVESQVGNFSADILAKESETERKIIIENQLDDTNHDHLGKIITYAAGKEASYIIWIVKRAREEHKAAVEWLNDHTNEDIGFFLCEIKLYQIDDSKLAPMFVTVAVPNDWKKEQKRIESKELSDNQRMLIAFWSAFNDYAWMNSEFSKKFRKRKAGPHHWYDLSIGTSEAHIGLVRFTSKNAVNAEFYISNNKELFDKLNGHKNEIEEETGIKFNWQRLDAKKASAIRVKENFIFDNDEDLTKGFDWLMNVAMQMKKVFLKYM